MPGYGQFCSVARAHEVLGRPVDPSDRAGNPVRQPPLQRHSPGHSPRVPHRAFRTAAGARLCRSARPDRRPAWSRIRAHRSGPGAGDSGERPRHMGTALAQAREPANEDLDLEPLLVDMQRRVRFPALPKEPLVVRFEIRGHRRRFMLLKKNEASLCHQNPGFPEPVCVRGPLAALVAWWRGDMSFVEAQRMGLRSTGRRRLPGPFRSGSTLYPFAHIGPAGHETNKSPARVLAAMSASRH